MVIKAIEKIAEDQGFKSLKFKNRKGAIFHNADWIAEVDYDENIQQDADDDKAYEDDESGDQEQDEEIDDEEHDQIDEEELEDLIEDHANKPIPTNIAMKDKATMKPREKKNNQTTTQMQSYQNKKPTHKEVNLEDPQGRADQFQDSNQR
jgi:hypothetical protein